MLLTSEHAEYCKLAFDAKLKTLLNQQVSVKQREHTKRSLLEKGGGGFGQALPAATEGEGLR